MFFRHEIIFSLSSGIAKIFNRCIFAALHVLTVKAFPSCFYGATRWSTNAKTDQAN